MRVVIATNGDEEITEALPHSTEFFEVFNGSIFYTGCECLVAPGNSFGIMDGGLDEEFARRFPSIPEKVSKFREIVIGDSRSYYIPNGYLIYAPTMRIPMDVSNTVNAYLSTVAAMRRALQLGVESVAFPAMCYGVGCMPAKVVARQMFMAISDPMWVPNVKNWTEAVKNHLQLLCREDEIPEREALGQWDLEWRPRKAPIRNLPQ